jgi:Holliday junction resolvasome RuvABC endonuclease subunit
MRILSLDPGTTNFGYGVLDVRHKDSQTSFRVLENGKCPFTVKTLKTAKVMGDEMALYELWLGDLVARYAPDAVAAERFMTRGINGPTVECVNIMIGITLSLMGKPFKIMPAATWKNAVTRQGVDLKEQYKKTMVTPHQVDACMIGLYTGCQAFRLDQFGDLDLPKLFPNFLRSLEETATFRLINRKI